MPATTETLRKTIITAKNNNNNNNNNNNDMAQPDDRDDRDRLFHAAVHSLFADRSDLTAAIETLKGALRSLQQQYTTLAQVLQSERVQSEAKATETAEQNAAQIASLTERLRREHVAGKQRLQELQAYASDMLYLQHECARLEESNAQDAQSNKIVQEDYLAKCIENADLHQALQTAQDQINTMKVQRVQSEAAASEQLQAMERCNATLAAELMQKNGRIKELTQQLESARESATTQTLLHNEAIAVKAEELATLTAQFEQASLNRNDRLKQLKESIAMLECHLTSQTQLQNEATTKAAEAAKAATEILTAQLGGANVEHAADHKTLKGTIAALERNLAVQTRLNDEATAKAAAAAKATSERLTAQLESAKLVHASERDQLQRDLELQKQLLKTAEDRVADLTAKQSRLHKYIRDVESALTNSKKWTVKLMARFKSDYKKFRKPFAQSSLFTKANLNTCIKDFWFDCIIEAIRKHDLFMLENFYTHGDGDINQMRNVIFGDNQSGAVTTLMAACWTGNADMVRLLLKLPGINVNESSKSDPGNPTQNFFAGNSALMIACRRGDLEIVRCLLAVPGIDVNYTCERSWSALMLASSYNHDSVVQELLKVPGIDLNKEAYIKSKSVTALTLAIEKGNRVIATMLKNDLRIYTKNLIPEDRIKLRKLLSTRQPNAPSAANE